jgi:bacteriorhodopsin
MRVQTDVNVHARTLERVMIASGFVVGGAVLLSLPWTARPWYYFGEDAVCIVSSLLVGWFWPMRSRSKASPAAGNTVSLLAGLSFFSCFAFLLMLLGYIAISAMYHGHAPGHARVAAVANKMLQCYVSLAIISYTNHRRRAAQPSVSD